eukprot:g11182.t1
MSLNHGAWIAQQDEHGRSYWIHSITGQRVNLMGGSPTQQAPIPIQYSTISPPQLGYSPSFLAHGHAVPLPPPLSLGPSYIPATVSGGRKWEELYDSCGNKYWVNALTRQSTTVDPYV